MKTKFMKYLIDFLIIVAIVLVGIYGYSKINTKFFKNDTQKVRITVEFAQINKDLLSQVGLGDVMSDNSKSTVLGTVVEKTPVKDATLTVKDLQKGRYLKTRTPKYGDMSIVIEGNATVTDSDISIGESLMKVGLKLGLKSDVYLIDGTILKIEVLPQDTKKEQK